MDEFSVNYGSIHKEYKTQTEKGTVSGPVKGGWSLKENRNLEQKSDDETARRAIVRETLAVLQDKLQAILAKLDPISPRPTALQATPNPRSRRGAALAKKRRR